MIRTIASGVLFVVLALASTFGGVYYKTHANAPPDAGHATAKKQFKKVKPISVPVIRDGELKGYVSAEFSYLLAQKEGHGDDADPESYILDEAFRQIYSNNDLDFSNIEKIDIVALTKQITANVNTRFGEPVVEETMIRNLNFVAREDLPH